jgi:hypothetical protein
MSLIKKIDVEKHFAARRALRLGRVLPASRSDATGFKPAAKKNSVRASAETLPLAKSSASVSPPPTLITSNPGRNGLMRPTGSRQP